MFIKKITSIILLVSSTLICSSQRQLVDTSVFQNFSFKNLTDCRQYQIDTIKNIARKLLIRSYQFNEKGNVSKILNSPLDPIELHPHKTLTILAYDNKDNLVSRTNYYTFSNLDTLEEGSKVLYFYNKEGLLEKSVCLSFVEKRQVYDTMFVYKRIFNSKGQKEIENLRNVDDNFLGLTGIKTFIYDEKDRIKEMHHIATHGQNHQFKDTYANYTIYYTYYGETSYKETQVFNSGTQQDNSFCETTYFKNNNGKIIKRIERDISNVKIEYLNGKYVPDSQSPIAQIDNYTFAYQYDKFDRIINWTEEHDYDDKKTGFKYHTKYSHDFEYKDDKIYNLPEEIYHEEQF